MKQHKFNIWKIIITMLSIVSVATIQVNTYADGTDQLPSEITTDSDNEDLPEETLGFDPDSITVSYPIPTSVYEIKNYSPECDISQSTPSGTNVINAMSAALVTGSLAVAEKTVEKTYDISFNCQLHYIAPKWISDTSNWQDTDYYENFSFMSTLTASVTFQYIASVPQIYSFEDMTVYNRLFHENDHGNGVITYSSANTEIPQPGALFRIHSLQAANSTKNYVQLSQGMALSNPYTYDYTPGDGGYHYSFYDMDNISVDIQVEGTQAGDWSGIKESIDQKTYEIVSRITSGTWSCNDYAQINDGTNSFLLMSDEKIYGANISGTINIVKDGKTLEIIDIMSINDVAASGPHHYGSTGYTMETINENCLASRITGFQIVSIPNSTDVSDAPTGIVAHYKDIFTQDIGYDIFLEAGKSYFGDSADSIYEHVMSDGILTWHNGGDPDDGYPIRIHMSMDTIEIADNLGHKAVEKTQLTTDSYNTDADNQLLLDSMYYVKWNNYGYASLVWENPSFTAVEDFDKYVLDKYLRFPFDVVYNGVFYYISESTGYTDWIQVTAPEDYQLQWNNEADTTAYESFNHWQMTPFYIPCFAQEGGGPGTDIYVEAKVIISSNAPNLEDGTEEPAPGSEDTTDGDIPTEESEYSIDKTEPEINTIEGDTRAKVQLSGWLYDLTVVGSDNGLIYNGNGLLESRKDPGYLSCSMSDTKMEIKSGSKNRLGTSNLRYLQDGSIDTSCLSERTLPLRNGSSLCFPDMGAVWKGQKVAFTVKTMAALVGDNDSIEIIPSIYFMTPDGEILSYEDEEIKIYITDAIGNWSGEEYNPANWDISAGERVKLGDPLFISSYYDHEDTSGFQHDWLQITLENENLSRSALGLSLITKQQFLDRNTPSYTISHISVPYTLRLFAGEYEQLAGNDGLMYNRDTGISDLRDYSEWENYDECITADRVLKSIQQWHFEYSVPTNINVIDVRNKGGADFSLSEYINNQERWWWNSDPDVYTDEGFLIIQLQITAYKDGAPYLRYSADEEQYLNMWEREGFNPEYPFGTVMFVDMAKSMQDYYLPAIQNIN